MEVDGEHVVLEEQLGGDHIELTKLVTRLPAINEEGAGEGSLSVGGGVTETEELKVGVVSDGFLDSVEAVFSRDGMVPEPVTVDCAEVLELSICQLSITSLYSDYYSPARTARG